MKYYWLDFFYGVLKFQIVIYKNNNNNTFMKTNIFIIIIFNAKAFLFHTLSKKSLNTANKQMLHTAICTAAMRKVARGVCASECPI